MIGKRKGALAAILGMALLVLGGCSDGPRTYEISGTLMVDGAVPAPGSSITFVPTDGKASGAGCTVENGKYTMKAAAGNYKVEIRAPKPTAKPKAKPKADEYQTQGEIVEESLPAKYNDSTELTFEVKAGKNEKSWDLKTK